MRTCRRVRSQEKVLNNGSQSSTVSSGVMSERSIAERLRIMGLEFAVSSGVMLGRSSRKGSE